MDRQHNAALAAFTGSETLLSTALLELGLAKRSLVWSRSLAGPSIGAFILFSVAFGATFFGSGPKPFHWGGLLLGAGSVLATLVFWGIARWRMGRASALARKMPETAPALNDEDVLRSLSAGANDDAAFLARAILRSRAA